MSIIALSYHVFHAKTSRHVSYLRKGKNVAPRQGSSRGPARLKLNECKRLDASVPFPLDASAPAKYNRNYQKQALRGAAEFARFSAYFAASCLLLPKSHLGNCEQFSFHICGECGILWETARFICARFRRILRLSCAMIVPVSGHGPASPRRGGMQRGGKEGHRCQREFRRCGTLSPPCW